jgi:hypothetical protein
MPFGVMGSPSHVRMLTRPPGGQLLGRQREREVLGRLLIAARGGDGGVSVVHGEPGGEDEAAALADAYLERANTRARLAARDG